MKAKFRPGKTGTDLKSVDTYTGREPWVNGPAPSFFISRYRTYCLMSDMIIVLPVPPDIPEEVIQTIPDTRCYGTRRIPFTQILGHVPQLPNVPTTSIGAIAYLDGHWYMMTAVIGEGRIAKGTVCAISRYVLTWLAHPYDAASKSNNDIVVGTTISNIVAGESKAWLRIIGTAQELLLKVSDEPDAGSPDYP